MRIRTGAGGRPQHLALKRCERAFYDVRGMGSQLQFELHLMKTLDHPNVVKCVAAEMDAQHAYVLILGLTG